MRFIVGLIVVAFAVPSKSDKAKFDAAVADIQRCNSSAPNVDDCKAKAVTNGIVAIADGIPDYHLSPFEPLELKDIPIGKKGSAALIKHKLEHVKIYGLTKKLNVKFETSDTNSTRVRWTGCTERLDLVGDYVINGKLLFQNFTRNGHVNITMVRPSWLNTMECVTYQADSKVYTYVKNYEIKISPKKVIAKMNNFFIDVPSIDNMVTNFVSMNSNLLFKKIRRSIEEQLSSIFITLANAMFASAS